MAHPLAQQVYQLTARPDLQMGTEQAIKSVIREIHNRDDFPRDLVEAALEATTYNDVTTVALPPTCRKVSYVREANTAWPMPGQFVEPITAGMAVTTAKYRRNNCFYVIGSTIHARLENSCDQLLVGFYQFPPFDATDWVVQLYPDVVVNGVAARMFQRLGDGQWQSFAQSYAIGVDQLWRNELYPQGVDVEVR